MFQKVVITSALLLAVFQVFPAEATSCPDQRCGSTETICPATGSYFCSLCNDPQLCTFSNDQSLVDVLGAFLFSQFTCHGPVSLHPNANVTVIAQTSRINGKILVTGLQLNFLIQCRGRFVNIVLNLSTGQVNGTTQFTLTDLLGITWQYEYPGNDQETSFVIKEISNCCTVSVIIRPDKFFLISIDCLNITIGIRPPLLGLPPCIFVQIAGNNVVSFESNVPQPSQLCLSQFYSISDLALHLGMTSNSDALSFQALTGSFSPPYDVRPANFNSLRDLALSCPADKRQDFSHSTTFLRDHNFVKCASNNQDEEGLVNVSLDIGRAVCFNNSESCQSLRSLILNQCSNIESTLQIIQFYNSFCLPVIIVPP